MIISIARYASIISYPRIGIGQAGGFPGWIAVKKIHRNRPHYKQTHADDDDEPQWNRFHGLVSRLSCGEYPPAAPPKIYHTEPDLTRAGDGDGDCGPPGLPPIRCLIPPFRRATGRGSFRLSTPGLPRKVLANPVDG